VERLEMQKLHMKQSPESYENYQKDKIYEEEIRLLKQQLDD
jgi:hypothetical protein